MATLKQAPFTRVLEEGMTGIDVEGVGRALIRGGFAGDFTLAHFAKLPVESRQMFGGRKVEWLDDLERAKGHKRNHKYERAQHLALLPAFDAKAANLMVRWEAPAAFCSPLPKGAPAGSGVCQRHHETSGVAGNWAYDWCVPEITGNGTAILAVADAIVTRLSGTDPKIDDPDNQGVFGWSIYYVTRAGYEWYWTHFGSRQVKVGDRIRTGQIIGRVGDQDFRPDHVHGGVRSPFGESDARRMVERIANAPRVRPLALT